MFVNAFVVMPNLSDRTLTARSAFSLSTISLLAIIGTVITGPLAGRRTRRKYRTRRTVHRFNEKTTKSQIKFLRKIIIDLY